MKLNPRPSQAPRGLRASWALSVIAGASLLLVGPHPPRPEAQTLGPSSVTTFLRSLAGSDAHDIRVNGLYGSGHRGAWQFTAHLTWHTANGDVAGGTTTLPQLAGQPPLDTVFSADRLSAEEQLGWPLSTLDAALDKVSHPDATLAVIDLEIPLHGPARLIACSANHGTHATCETRDRSGRRRKVTTDELLDQPWLDAASVQRLSAPLLP